MYPDSSHDLLNVIEKLAFLFGHFNLIFNNYRLAAFSMTSAI